MNGPRVLTKGRFSFADLAIAWDATEWTPPAVYEAQVASAWKRRVDAEPGLLWDGLYYRVLDLEPFGASCVPELLRLGFIRYRYIATYSELSEQAAALQLPPLQHLSIVALLRTLDGFYLFGERARNAALEPIGGGVQHDELKVTSGADLERNLCKEIREETGLGDDAFGSIAGIGFLLASNTNVLAAGHMQLQVTRAEAEACFALGRHEGEMRRLVFVEAARLRSFLSSLPDYRAQLVELLEEI